MVSSPAIMRSKVDLPQPDGPTSTTNSPSTMSRSTPWITSTAPKVLRTPRMVTWAIVAPNRHAPHRHAIDLKLELPDRRTEVYPEPTTGLKRPQPPDMDHIATALEDRN